MTAHAVKHAPDWTLVTPDAGWRPRDSMGEFVYQDHMWILGGWFTPQTPNPRDVWKSPDGAQWTCVVETAPWEHSDLSAAMVFKERMWFMGGRKLPGAENSNKVWSSRDGAEWRLETDAAGWCPRVAPAFAVFKDKMWILGGTEHFYDHDDDLLHNDVWCSSDGKQWTCVTEHAAWPKRAHAQAAVFDGKLWLLGGGLWHPQHKARNDVWFTEDGEHWTQATPAAPWEPRLWFSAVVYRGLLWVLGGWSKEHDNFDDVWCTRDGARWTQVKSERIWKARHEHSAFVFRGKIWVAGGHARPLNSEVWSLEIPEGWDEGV